MSHEVNAMNMKDLTKTDLFAGIDEAGVKMLLPCLNARERHYEKNDIIALEDDRIRFIGLVLEGTVNMVKEDIWGNETLLSFISPGEVFGETFALQSNPSSYVTFIAGEDCQVLFMRADDMIRSCPTGCKCHGQLTKNIFNILGKKSVMLMEKIQVSSRSSLREKILSYLSILAEKQGGTTVESPLNRTRMADYLGVNRSAMTRELSSMKREGLIDFEKNTYQIYSDELEEVG